MSAIPEHDLSCEPTLGDRVPQRSNPRVQRQAARLLQAAGWKVRGQPPNLPQVVLVFAPHTSNWDWPVCILSMLSLGLDAQWMGKHTIFRGPLGPLMRSLGGIAIVRSQRGQVVDEMVAEFGRRERLWVGISPEGTRRKVQKWKTGFYHIAQRADVPILLCSLDYGSRTLGLGPTLRASGNLHEDLEHIQSYYQQFTACNPEWF